MTRPPIIIISSHKSRGPINVVNGSTPISFPAALSQVLACYGFALERPLTIVLEHGTATITAAATPPDGRLARIAGVRDKIEELRREVAKAGSKFDMASIEQRRSIQMFMDLRRREIVDLERKSYDLEREYLREEMAAYAEGKAAR